MIKYSKELNKLLNKFLSEDKDDNLGQLLNMADLACTEGSNDYRPCDYAGYVDVGVSMVLKSQKIGKPIYCIHSDYTSGADMILYFVDDLDLLKTMFHKLIKLNEEKLVEKEDQELEELEARVATLKKKKKVHKADCGCKSCMGM